jgi:hypothetical protein
MGPLAVVAVFALSGVLLWAGMEKLRDGAGFDRTLAAIGVPAALRPAVRFAVPAAELVVGASLVLAPGQAWPRVGALLLAAAFAVAGGLGLLAAEDVTCSCFGATGGGKLGWAQLAALPVWVLAVLGAAALERPWSWPDGVQYLAALIVALCVLRSVPLLREWRVATGNRVAIDESVVQRAPILQIKAGEQ